MMQNADSKPKNAIVAMCLQNNNQTGVLCQLYTSEHLHVN